MTTETTTIDAAISRAQREMDLIREYRTRLVADVVTGQLDVRNAAARLPVQLPAESEPDDNGPADEALREEVELEAAETE